MLVQSKARVEVMHTARIMEAQCRLSETAQHQASRWEAAHLQHLPAVVLLEVTYGTMA
jgi:hypothetical protein